MLNKVNSVKGTMLRVITALLIIALVLPVNLIAPVNVFAKGLSSVIVQNNGISVENGYLLGVPAETTVEKFLKYFSGNEITVRNTGDFVGTGSTVQLIENGSVIETATVVVLGDTDGNGKISSMDYLRIKRAFLNTYNLGGAFLKAACISGGASVSSRDYMYVKRHFMNTYNLYSSGTKNYNNTKVAYIPLDDRPVNTDRVIYLAESAGYNLMMPDADLYSTKLDGTGTNKNGTKYGDREKLLEWLKKADLECDYFVISLDQILSGGLVQSRVQNNTDLTREYEIIDYLINLNKNNKVYFFDTVMRLASTSNYNGYGGTEYNILRNYGSVGRKILPSSELTISKIVAGYKYNTTGGLITSSLTQDQINSYLAARERKLRLTDYILSKGGTELNYCYIGVDDSSPSNNIQTNEISYIKSKINSNGILFAGCDELGMMALSRLTSDLYEQKLNVCVTYFGGGENSAADGYDIGTLKSNVQDHLSSLNAVLTTSDKASLDVLVLTKPTSLSVEQYSDQLLDRLEQNLNNKRPTVVINASTKNGPLEAKMSEREIPLSTLVGYSSWNTVGNAIGIAVSQGITRTIYLKTSANVTSESNIGFMKSMTFAYVKDISYKIGNVSGERLISLLNNSLVITSVNSFRAENIGKVNVYNYRQPWSRSFEIRFDISVA